MKLTQRYVESLNAQGKTYSVWCEELIGFGVRVNTSGAASYIAKYRVEGQQKLVTIGRVQSMKCEAARRTAKELIGAAAGGVDIVGQKKAERTGATVESLAERFVREYLPNHLKPSTQAEYKRFIELFITPRLGDTLVASLDRGRIASFHQSMAATPYQANRVLATLSVMLNQAEIWGLKPEGINPCLRVKRFKEIKRERYLSEEELRRLAVSIHEEAAQAPMAAAAFKLLIFTGCRLSEVQKLKWREVDLDNGVLRLEDTKTGARKVYLSKPAIDVLSSIPRLRDNPYVICGKEIGEHLTDLQRPWRRVRKRAGLPDVRIHDLRHTFAANAAASGLSLPMIGKLLGHTQAQTTARYAHLADDPVRLASDVVSQRLSKNIG